MSEKKTKRYKERKLHFVHSQLRTLFFQQNNFIFLNYKYIDIPLPKFLFLNKTCHISFYIQKKNYNFPTSYKRDESS